MTGLTGYARVAAARELLEGWSEEEYDALPADCRANVQEAIEFLLTVEQTVTGGDAKK